jgi:toxin ParE1/3/4
LILFITDPAKVDMERAFAFLSEDNPRAAEVMVERILKALESLQQLPNRGRPGRWRGTREFIVPQTGYIAIYRVGGQRVTVIRIVHGHQDWPPR